MVRMRAWLVARVALGTLVFGAAFVQAQDDAKSTPTDPNVVARVGDSVITIQEVDAKALATDMKLAQSLFDARLAAIDQIVMERALSQEAAAQNVPVDELLRRKIEAQSKPVTDEDLRAYYDANSARMRGQTFEQISGDIRNYLTSQAQNVAKQQLLTQIKKDANVKVTLEPPRVEVAIAANDPTMGPPGAKVTIVEFSDFQ